MKYLVEVKGQDEELAIDYFNTKRGVVRFIAQTMGVSQMSLRDEIEARKNKQHIKRDSLGYRADIYYDDGSY